LTGEQKLNVPIKSMMCWNSNPVTQAPETEKILKGLRRKDLFLVSAEHFISDTAAYADILLPASMGAEMEDIILSWGHLYLTYNTKCVESPGEAIPNNDIFRRLAKRLGFEEDNFKWNDSECLEHYIDWNSPACKGIDLDYLKKNGYARLNVGTKDNRAPHKEGNFPTPSGKCEFRLVGAKNFVAGPFRQMYEDFQPGEDIPELPDYIPSKETALANPELFKKYPLNILSPKSHGFINSSYANIDNKLKAQGEQFVLINQADAMNRGIHEGEKVKVFNDRGAFDAIAKITLDVNKGIVVATLGYWRQLNNGTVNSIGSSAFGDMGNAPTSHDCLVEVHAI
jgi:anaerobic selenocysteine-containing dehydrogenase